MADPTIAFGMRELIITCVGAVAAILGFNAKNVVSRLNKHDERFSKTVHKDEYNETIRSIRASIEKGMKEAKEATEKAHDKQTKELREFYNHMTSRMDTLADKDK